jgi:hypothetical protein
MYTTQKIVAFVVKWSLFWGRLSTKLDLKIAIVATLRLPLACFAKKENDYFKMAFYKL